MNKLGGACIPLSPIYISVPFESVWALPSSDWLVPVDSPGRKSYIERQESSFVSPEGAKSVVEGLEF